MTGRRHPSIRECWKAPTRSCGGVPVPDAVSTPQGGGLSWFRAGRNPGPESDVSAFGAGRHDRRPSPMTRGHSPAVRECWMAPTRANRRSIGGLGTTSGVIRPGRRVGIQDCTGHEPPLPNPYRQNLAPGEKKVLSEGICPAPSVGGALPNPPGSGGGGGLGGNGDVGRWDVSTVCHHSCVPLF